MSRVQTLDPDAVSIGYVLPTRDAVTLERPAAGALLALGRRAEALGFDAVWVGDGPLARGRARATAAQHRALLRTAACADAADPGDVRGNARGRR